MTARREIDRRLRTLGEIRDIMNSMKTLAYMETRKLDRFLAMQRQLVEMIEDTAGDFLAHYPDLLTASVPDVRGYVLIGSERGFCGRLNEEVVRYLNASGMNSAAGSVIAVGDRLARRLEGDPRLAGHVAGASASEEVPAVLDGLVRAIGDLQGRRGPLALDAVYHEVERGGLATRALFPPFTGKAGRSPRFAHPPVLNLPPRDFFAELLDQYLFAVLHETLYTSLRAENQRRVQHLDAAIRHLEDKQRELARRSRVLRQEEIVEEIEVILLSVDAPRVGPGTPGS